MQYLKKLESYQSDKRSAVTLGKFDALHRGHQKLLDQIRRYQSEDVVSIVCAFDMGKDSLLTAAQRQERLEGCVDCLIACEFTREIREMEAETFIKEILIKRLKAAYIVVGTDFCFGYEKRGDVRMLEKYAAVYGYHLDVIEKETYDGKVISSTYVKECLREGNVGLAEKLLGYPYTVRGVVEHGRALGRTLGFPTMNIAWEEHKIAPRFGVYACRVSIETHIYHGIANVGVKPTVTREERLLTEVYVFGYAGNAYGKEIAVEFLEFERTERRFGSAEELKAQVEQDIRFAKEYFAESEQKTQRGTGR